MTSSQSERSLEMNTGLFFCSLHSQTKVSISGVQVFEGMGEHIKLLPGMNDCWF